MDISVDPEIKQQPLPLSADALACVLDHADGISLATSEAVNREWSACAAHAWSKLLASTFSMAGTGDARKQFAAEWCWTRGRWVRATIDARVATVRAVSVASSQHVLCASPGSAHSSPALSRHALPAEHSLRPLSAREPEQTWNSPASGPATVCAAHAEGAAFGFGDGTIDVTWTPPASARTLQRVVVRPCELGASEAPAALTIAAEPGGGALVVSGGVAGRVSMFLCTRAHAAEVAEATQAAQSAPPAQGLRADTASADSGCAPPIVSYAPVYGRCTAVSCDGAAHGVVVAGWKAGHVEVLDRAGFGVVTSALSSCACPPLCLATDADARLLSLSRSHHTRGSGHGQRVEVFDIRRGLSAADRITDLWPRRLVGIPSSSSRDGSSGGSSGLLAASSCSLAALGAGATGSGGSGKSKARALVRVMSVTEEVVGVHVDAAKVVSCNSDGMVCAWDCRNWQQLLSGFAGEYATGKPNLEPVTPGGVSVGGEWLAATAGSSGLVHAMSVRA